MSRAVAGLVATAATLALALPLAAEAIHEVDHRLEAETDADGFYLVIVHLHDEDMLQVLRVAVGPRTTLRLEARFNPVDSRTPRGTQVDFTDAVPRERPEEFASGLERYVRK